MAQVGHGHSKVTLESYAQVLKRRDREQIGWAFDHLLVGGGSAAPPVTAGYEAPDQSLQDGGATRPQSPLNRVDQSRDRAKDRAKTQNGGTAHPALAPLKRRNPQVAGVPRVELAGLEPATSCMPCRRSPS
jgi:hypothetical protein